MRFRSSAALIASAMFMLLGCERQIDLGDIGSETGGAGGEEPGLPARLVFSSDFDSGDLTEWGIDSDRLETTGGVFSVEAERAQAGGYSALVVTNALGEHTAVSTSLGEKELLIGFWLRLQETYNTSNWPFLHLDQIEETGITELWDLGFGADGDGTQTLFLWEKPVLANTVDGSQIADASESFGLDRWVHIQVHWLAENNAGGFLRVYQDERLVMDLTDRPTSLGGEIYLGFGSFIFAIEPLPAAIWLDTITVHAR